MKRCLLIFAGFCLFTLQVQAQDKINKSKKAITESEGVNYKKQSTSQTSSSSSDSTGLGESAGGAVVGFLFKCTFGAVWYGLVGNYNNEDQLTNDLTEYPFYEHEAGNYYNPKFGEESVYVFRVDAKDKFIYSSNDLLGNHLELKVRPFQYFYLKADYYQIYEFQKLAGTSDNLSLFYFNFAYDRLRFERFNLGWMLGASYVGSNVNRAGISFGANAEYFLKKNISFMAGAKWSFINNEPVHALSLKAAGTKRIIM